MEPLVFQTSCLFCLLRIVERQMLKLFSLLTRVLSTASSCRKYYESTQRSEIGHLSGADYGRQSLMRAILETTKTDLSVDASATRI